MSKDKGKDKKEKKLKDSEGMLLLSLSYVKFELTIFFQRKRWY